MATREQVAFRLREYERRESQLNDEGMITLGTPHLAPPRLPALAVVIPRGSSHCARHRSLTTIAIDRSSIRPAVVVT